MRLRNTRSTRSSITKSAGRILLVFCHVVIWAIVPLVALWPAGDPHSQTTAMFLAVQHGNLAAIDEALRGGLDLNSRDETGITPLMAAARGGHIDVIRKLLAAGARIDDCVPIYGTALMAAAMCGHHDVMRELVDRGANVDAANQTGQTALWFARMGCDEEAVRILIAGGARVEGHSAAPGEAGVLEHGTDTRTPSEARAIETTHSAVPASAVRVGETSFVRPIGAVVKEKSGR